MVPMRALLRELESRRQEMVRLLGGFVRAESPSFDKAAVDRFGRMVAAEWKKCGARVTLLHQRTRGDHVRAQAGAQRNNRACVNLAHV